jgi:predicted TIM-barrel fold metal-dependent hydrolase
MRAFLSLLLTVPACLLAQQGASAGSAPVPTIDEYNPKAMLVVPQHKITRAKYPFIDIHTHQRDASPAKLDQLIRDMDSINMRIMISSPVSGSFGDKTKQVIEGMRAHAQKERFRSMTNINYALIDEPQKMAEQLTADIKNGAVGLKVWKNFGMREKDSKGARIPIDDPRLDAVWDVCAKYKIPVMIHTADPKPLFDPMTKDNERYLELKLRPNRGEAGSGLTWDQLIKEQHSLFAKHPKTIFINAHMGWMAHDLGAMGELLDRLPNVNLEFAAVLGELGRQPREARKFFVKYQDRILFGKDTYNVGEYGFYFRMLETGDEYIDNIRHYHGLWKLYALELPDDVLKKVYYKNALRLVPGLSSEGFPK